METMEENVLIDKCVCKIVDF